MISIRLDSDPTPLLYMEREERRLLFHGDQLIAIQQSPGEEVQVETKYAFVTDFFCSVWDGPELQLPPQGPNPALLVHSVLPFEPNAHLGENQITGEIDGAPHWLITASFQDGIKSFSLSNEMQVSKVHMGFDGRLWVDHWGAPAVTNLGYLRSAVRRYLKAQLGEDWAWFG